MTIRKVMLIFLLALGSTLLSAPAFAKGKDSGISIPVRLGVFTGGQYGKISFEADKKNLPSTNYIVGLDFNVPIPPIRTLVGIKGWFTGPTKTGSTIVTSSLFIGPYIGYLGKSDDILLGFGTSLISSRLTDDEAIPNTQITLHQSVPCGFAGWRHYFKTKIPTGIGLTGYACQSSEYEKSVLAPTETKSTVPEKVTNSGGIFYFLITWDEERKLI